MKSKMIIAVLVMLVFSNASAQYAPAAGEIGTTAIEKDSSVFIAWATGAEVRRGFLNISDTNVELSGSNKASFGDVSEVLGIAEGNSGNVMSLGDSGEVVLTFANPILNGAGPDFAVFENSFADDYLEFAFVEVSSNGIDFFRFPSFSNIPYDTQTGAFSYSDPTLVKNLAGKYRQGFGTPFDLDDLSGTIGLDLNAISHVKVLDVVGSINPIYGGETSEGGIVNDPFPTPFESGGFDLDAIGVIHNATNSIKETNVVEFSVYPKPSSGFIKITNINSVDDLKLFDLSGRFVAQLPLGSQIDLNSFASKGVYLIEISVGNMQTVKRITIH